MRLLEAELGTRRVQRYAPTIVVLIISLSLALVFALATRNEGRARAEAAFIHEVRSARDAIVDVVRTYEQSLRAGAGLAEAAGPKEDPRERLKKLRDAIAARTVAAATPTPSS